MIVHRNWYLPYGDDTHNALPLSDPNMLVIVDKAVQNECAGDIKYV